MTRMLLSHNFNLFQAELPELTREQFAEIFSKGLETQAEISASAITNPHWMVEVIYDETQISATEVGQICCNILVRKRQEQLSKETSLPHVLFLGGKKTTPPMSTSPTSLQTGEYGVDVVETANADDFLAGIRWQEMTADKPPENIFKVEYREG